MIRINLRGNIRDALNQVVPYLLPEFPQQGIEEGIQETQAHTINIVGRYLEGNPYSGKGFTRQQGELALETIRQQTWNKSNLGTCLAQVRAIIDPPKPQ